MKQRETRGNKQQGKAQVVRVFRESHSRRRAGETLRAIFDDLTARGEITIPMRTFTRWVTRLEKDETYQPLPSNPQQIPVPKPEQASGRRAGDEISPGQSPASSVQRKEPRHGIAGVERPKAVSTEINRAELF